MDCGSAMLSVPPPVSEPPAPPPPQQQQSALAASAVFAPPDTDQAQFEADKRAVYKCVIFFLTLSLCVCCLIFRVFFFARHPLFPLLALLFERCELATQSSDPQSSDAFNLDIQAFVQHQERDRKPFLVNEPEIDGLVGVFPAFFN